MTLSRFSGRARASGAEVTGGVFAVYRFRDGKRKSSTSATALCLCSFARQRVRPKARVICGDAKRSSWNG